MKKLVILFVLCYSAIYSQDLHHQMFSAQGKSNILNNGMYVSQTIGQQSVSGNYTTGNKTYVQGFQQSNWSKHISQNSPQSNILTTTFPNPFISTVNFQFSSSIGAEVSVSLFDVRGRLIYHEIKNVASNVLTIDLPNLASSNYLVRLSARNYLYHTQILKQ